MGYVGDLRLLVGTRPLILVGAAVIVRDKRGAILLQRRVDNNKWSLPGGALEPGETLAEAARREVLEETRFIMSMLSSRLRHGRAACGRTRWRSRSCDSSPPNRSPKRSVLQIVPC
ncbi:MAG TPA: NUDIX domain-containing protein [bacterium]|nr:NUDIX domain-containing protein [bacterium]